MFGIKLEQPRRFAVAALPNSSLILVMPSDRRSKIILQGENIGNPGQCPIRRLDCRMSVDRQPAVQNYARHSPLALFYRAAFNTPSLNLEVSNSRSMDMQFCMSV